MLIRFGNRHHHLHFLIQRLHRRHLTSDGTPHDLQRSTKVNGTKSVSLVFILGTWSCWPTVAPTVKMLIRFGNRHHHLHFLIQRLHRRHLTSDGTPHDLQRSTKVNATKSVSLVFILGTWSCWPTVAPTVKVLPFFSTPFVLYMNKISILVKVIPKRRRKYLTIILFSSIFSLLDADFAQTMHPMI
ncbi:unnamed protein product [Lactuca saligna]|uniref:Uncharacterized protein n=1 Tax=Lactuca saligna TaxID=75948 RepID=A0AA35Z8Q4_LACSI|nr:unnamed protein product [Lactuca saligna]